MLSTDPNSELFHTMKLRLIPTLIMALSMPLAAQADGLAFGQARALMQERADVLKMSAADIQNQRYQIKDADALNGPKITLNAKQIEGRKDINLSYGLSEVKSTLTGALGQIGGGLAAAGGGLSTAGGANPQVPAGTDNTYTNEALQGAGSGLTQVGQALQGLGTMIPDTLKINFEQDISGPRASVDVMWPLYTGGAITAKQNAARAGLRKAQADHDSTVEKLDAQLAQKYFGVQLARSVEKLRSDMLAQQERDLHRAKRFEKAGMIAKIERMSAEVNRDTARRELIAAQTDRKIAETELADLLREDNVGALDTPMFVVKNIEPLIEWQTKALNHNPVLKAIDAQRDQAQQGVRAAKSAFHPQVYLFGQYNFIKHYLTISEPDWVAGIGVNFTLWDNRDRSARVGSAQSLVNKVDAAQDSARHEIKKLVEIAWLRSAQALEQHELTQSAVALATENLRLRDKAFKEGMSTIDDVNDARNKLIGAEVAQRVAAYRFVVSYSLLHAASGQMNDFLTVFDRADFVVQK